MQKFINSVTALDPMLCDGRLLQLKGFCDKKFFFELEKKG
jgi:hypothetical protein